MDLRQLDAHFWLKVDVRDPDDCWPWTQSCGSHGYGQTWDGRTVLLAHRVAFELAKGPIPDGLTVDHKCRFRPCCNPGHLRLLPNVDNARDNGNAGKTHCPHGHPYVGSNLYVTPRGHRRCRACWTRHKEVQRQRKRVPA
jgi:hypothetical protein